MLPQKIYFYVKVFKIDTKLWSLVNFVVGDIVYVCANTMKTLVSRYAMDEMRGRELILYEYSINKPNFNWLLTLRCRDYKISGTGKINCVLFDGSVNRDRVLFGLKYAAANRDILLEYLARKCWRYTCSIICGFYGKSSLKNKWHHYSVFQHCRWPIIEKVLFRWPSSFL